jgi:hypothetical protein
MERMRRRGSTERRRVRVARSLVVAAIATGLLALLTGCLGGDVEVRVDGDGSGRVEAEVLLDPATSSALEQVDVSSLVGRVDTTSDVEIEAISQRGLDGYRIVVPFDDVASLTTVLTQGVDVAGARVRLMESLSITNDATDDSWTMDAVVLPAEQVVAQLRATGLPGLDGAEAAAIDLSLSVALPGQVVRTNAPSSDGGTATWPVGDYRTPAGLQMRTEPATFPTPVQMVLGGALLAVLLGVVLALWGASAAARRRGTKGRPRPRRRSRRERRGGAGGGGWAPPGGASAGAPYRGETLPPLQGAGDPPAAPAAPSDLTDTPPSDPPGPAG